LSSNRPKAAARPSPAARGRRRSNPDTKSTVETPIHARIEFAVSEPPQATAESAPAAASSSGQGSMQSSPVRPQFVPSPDPSQPGSPVDTRVVSPAPLQNCSSHADACTCRRSPSPFWAANLDPRPLLAPPIRSTMLQRAMTSRPQPRIPPAAGSLTQASTQWTLGSSPAAATATSPPHPAPPTPSKPTRQSPRPVPSTLRV